jgi:putative transposase
MVMRPTAPGTPQSRLVPRLRGGRLYDFVEDRTHDKRKVRLLNVIDEFTRECLTIRVSRRLNSTDVIDVLSDLFIRRGVPGHIRLDNGPEFIAKSVREWISSVGTRTAYIEPGSPWENGYCESFNSKLRDELLNGEIFYTLKEAQVIIESWRYNYNTLRPHSSLGYKPPAPETLLWPAAQPGPASPATPALALTPTINEHKPRTATWGPANDWIRGADSFLNQAGVAGSSE